MVEKMMHLNFFKKIALKARFRQISYSQCGEDLILSFIFRNLIPISKPSFLDIGCHHPFFLNNTFLLYSKGSRGINVDANLNSIKLFEKYRADDKNICVGVSDVPGNLVYYQNKESSLNTFDDTKVGKGGGGFIGIGEIEVVHIESIIDKFNGCVYPDLLSLDVEGFDSRIIRSIDFKKTAPKVICVETISRIGENQWERDFTLINYLKEKGYIHHSDTGINSIFILESHLRHKIK